MTRKGKPTEPAKRGRATERKQTERKREINDFGAQLRQFGEGLKEAITKRQAEQAFKHFSANVEDAAVHSFSVPASLVKPEMMVRHGDRVIWQWTTNGISVLASLIMTDSPHPEDHGVVHGSRAGEWVVDIVGPGGSACYQLNADQAKDVGEIVLSAVYWRFAYLDYMAEYIGEFEETDEMPSGEGTFSAEVIPIYDK